MITLQKMIFRKSIVISLSEILVFVFALLVAFYCHDIYDYSLIFYYGLIVLLGTLCTLSIYIRIYRWRNLDLSFTSFIFFYLNIIQMLIYIFAISIFFKLLYNENTTTPIYLDDLSIFSQYRYLVLTSISIVMLLGFIIIKFFGYKVPSLLTFPYLKDEIRKILDTWKDVFIDDICSKLIDLLYLSFWFRIFFFSVHFIIFYMIRLYSIGLLFYCTFFHGDFISFLKLTPILFLVWLLSFFSYYFFYFQEACTNYIRSLLSVTLEKKNLVFPGIVKLDSTSKVLFTLTEEAISKGYTKIDIDHLAKEWYMEAGVSTYFMLYFKIITYINYIILVLQLSIWFYLAYFFFFSSFKSYFLSILGSFWRPLGKSPFIFRSYATSAHRVLLPHQKNLNIVTEGAHTGNHPALIDLAVRNPDDPLEVLYEGELTHGKGSVANPSYPLHATRDLQGNNKAQNFVPTKNVTYTPEHFYDLTSIPGSQTFLDDPQVKMNLAKYTPKAEET